MFTPIDNVPRDYAWGAPGAISELFGRPPTTSPEAELWLGDHPGDPSDIVGSDRTLRDELGAESLPYLLKILAAGAPLSLQAHPTIAQAKAGFARENELGVALDDPTRNYKDELHKPEIIVALSDRFDALCGFRPVAESRRSFERLGEAARPVLDRLRGDADLRDVFEWLITRGDGVTEIIAGVSEAARSVDGDPSLATVGILADAYPGDPGIVISVLLHTVSLERGQALYLPAGNIHAYLAGTGVELMAASDNVLRGGLTPKHVDVPELLSVLDFAPLPVPTLALEPAGDGLVLARPPITDFLLAIATPRDSIVPVPLTGPTIAVCTSGSVTLDDGEVTRALPTGSAVLVRAVSSLAVTGSGDVFLAMPGAASG